MVPGLQVLWQEHCKKLTDDLFEDVTNHFMMLRFAWSFARRLPL